MRPLPFHPASEFFPTLGTIRFKVIVLANAKVGVVVPKIIRIDKINVLTAMRASNVYRYTQARCWLIGHTHPSYSVVIAANKSATNAKTS
jgi:hypothetical protein